MDLPCRAECVSFGTRRSFNGSEGRERRKTEVRDRGKSAALVPASGNRSRGWTRECSKSVLLSGKSSFSESDIESAPEAPAAQELLTPKGRAGFGSLLGHVMKGASSILPMPVRDRVGTIDENDETRVELSRSAQVRDV